MKQCNKCQIEKPLDAFYREKDSADGRRAQCKDCRNAVTYERRKSNPAAYNEYMQKWREANPEKVKQIENKRYQEPERRAYCLAKSKEQKASGYQYLSLYGITKAQKFQMVLEQDGRCALCNAHDSELKRGLMVDHCHTTKTVRGMLCDYCNKMLGNAKDNIGVLQKAIDYLKKFK